MFGGVGRAVLVVGLVGVLGGGCGSGEPAAVGFTRVELPGGGTPVELAASGDSLLIGVRRTGQPVVPGLLRRTPDGAISEIGVRGATPYGVLARWYSISSDGDRIVAIGGERGGAHGNVRWSVWDGQINETITEKQQGFSTFGGYGAGDLTAAVLTPVGPALIGGWESAQVGFDVAVWTADGDVWTRQTSAGTPLESARGSLGFPMAATTLQQGVLVVGWQLATEAGRSREQPAVWRSTSGNTGWTRSPLPDAGQVNAALSAQCWGDVCGVAGRVDGKLAMWRLANGAWARVHNAPPIPVGDRDTLAAPIEVDGRLTQVVSEGGQVKVARADGDRWTVRGATGPTGTVTAATRVGDTVYVLAGPDEDSQTLWRTDVGSMR